MNKKQWMIIALAFFLVLPASLPAFGWEKIIAFGDSLSDNGDADGYGFGVSSDGEVWLDYLASSMKDVILEDRALGGAMSSGHVSLGPDYGLDWQVEQYITGLGPIPEDGFDLSGILFTVWVGGNDFLQYGPYPGVADNAVNIIKSTLQDLIDAGAEDILVMNMPDLGLAPGVQFGNPTLITAFTAVSQYYNDCITAALCALRAENQGKNIKFYLADTFELLQFAAENGDLLGLPNVSIPCTWGEDCEASIFWDGIHPTTATHKYLAALALGQVKHGRIDKEMKEALKLLNPLQPRKPYVVQCVDN